MENDQYLLLTGRWRLRRQSLVLVDILTRPRRPVAGALPPGDARPAVDADQFGDAPHDVVFQFVSFAISIDDIPQNADEFDARRVVEMTLQNAGEGKEVDRFLICLLAGGEKRVELRPGHPIGVREGGTQPGALGTF